MKKFDLESYEAPVHQYRSIFLSDLHLGTRNSQADLLLDFLKYNEAEYIYLVGDIIDGWQIKRGWYWPQSHNDVLQKILRKARKGVKITYIPGNHDEFAREYCGMSFGGIEVIERAIHITADNKKFLVIHGDQFDIVVCNARWLAYLGDWAYEWAIFINTYYNIARRFFGAGYWSFSAWAKMKVKNAVKFIGHFETLLASEAKKNELDGVVCGHIHHPAIKNIDNIQYINIGDFVESCTAIAEHEDGHFEIIYWNETFAKRQKLAEPMITRSLPSHHVAAA